MINIIKEIKKDKKVFLSLYLIKIDIMLSISTKYAIKAVLYLAVNSTVEKKILAKDGGFYLNEENKNTFLIKIVDLIDGEHRLKSCVLSIHDCDADHPCPLHNMVGNTKTRFINKLETTSIQDLVFDIKNGKSFLPL